MVFPTHSTCCHLLVSVQISLHKKLLSDILSLGEWKKWYIYIFILLFIIKLLLLISLSCSTFVLIHFIHSFILSQALIVQDGPLASLFRVSWSHTYRHTAGLLWTSDQFVAETSTYTGQHNIWTQETNIHAPSGIRICYPSNQAAVNLRYRPRGHCNWLVHFNDSL
jgi:hypothetical protein